jgi:hypothetical protein
VDEAHLNLGSENLNFGNNTFLRRNLCLWRVSVFVCVVAVGCAVFVLFSSSINGMIRSSPARSKKKYLPSPYGYKGS